MSIKSKSTQEYILLSSLHLLLLLLLLPELKLSLLSVFFALLTNVHTRGGDFPDEIVSRQFLWFRIYVWYIHMYQYIGMAIHQKRFSIFPRIPRKGIYTKELSKEPTVNV